MGIAPDIKEDDPSCSNFNLIHNWKEMGEIILSSFEISSEKIGNILKSHLQNIVNSQIVSHTGGGVKLPKRRKVEENLVNVWEERKKNYLSNVSKKNKKKKKS